MIVAGNICTTLKKYHEYHGWVVGLHPYFWCGKSLYHVYIYIHIDIYILIYIYIDIYIYWYIYILIYISISIYIYIYLLTQSKWIQETSPVLTNCPRRRDGPCQGVRAGTNRASSNCNSMGLAARRRSSRRCWVTGGWFQPLWNIIGIYTVNNG